MSLRIAATLGELDSQCRLSRFADDHMSEFGVARARRWTGLSEAVYEGFPGMAAAFAVWFTARLLGSAASLRQPAE